jgi:aminoglycoside phosphotransferase (APT) family kinase protein
VTLPLARLPDLLIDLGLESRTTVLRDGVRIEPLRRRNLNAAVFVGDRPYFVKQGVVERDRISMAREAAALRLVGDNAVRVRASIPRVLAHDDSRALLVTDFVPGRTAWEDTIDHRRVRVRSAGRLGTAMGALHESIGIVRPGVDAETTRPAIGDAAAPWVADEIYPTVEGVAHLSAGRIAVTKIIQSQPDLVLLAQRAAARYRPSTLIHGDIKLENIVLSADGVEPKLRLIDFELSGIGDPRWDVGSAMASHLVPWLYSMSSGSAQTDGGARVPIESIQRGLRTMWASYVRLTVVSPEFLDAAVNFAALRLLQTAHESSQFDSRASSTSVAAIQVAFNVLRSPDQARRVLFGLS